MGYKDDPTIPSGGYWIVKNSWGTDAQNNGWFNIAYGEASIEEMPVLFEGVYGQFPILYVDDDNTDGPWEGSKENPYNTISKAIDKAYEGWTVFVKNGTYKENLVINKTINLDGESKDNTIIDGNNSGIVIYVQAPEVRISGLTIQNSGTKRLDSGIRTLSLDSNMTVKNCIIRDCDVGIYLNCIDTFSFKKSGNIIKDNQIIYNNIGIFTTWSDNHNIIENTICYNNLHGIEMEASKTSVIKDNIVCNNNEKGIYLHGACDENQIIGNTIDRNSYGLLIKETKKCLIKNNNFVHNTEQAGFLRSRANRWTNNYWSDWDKILPRPIRGSINIGNLPWFNFDLHPSTQMI
jgi:parallel beta-helix repeat protein